MTLEKKEGMRMDRGRWRRRDRGSRAMRGLWRGSFSPLVARWILLGEVPTRGMRSRLKRAREIAVGPRGVPLLS